MIAPIITPRKQARAEHAEERRHGDDELRTIAAPQLLERRHLKSPATATSTTAARTGCGRARRSCERKSTIARTMTAAKSARKRRARAAALVDQRLRHAAADRETAAEPGGEVRRGEGEEFLVGVEPAAVLGGEHAADGGRLHGAEQEAGEAPAAAVR